ncbi:DUF2922 domain-containing protein [Alteribacillus sp. HJP-4]|uniref:DUF2922 domain-containing protein n=1 Tax=Alteribacillus sp. HJP-4 TaxID=2775394 RepID=UPI0035CCE1B9
MSKRLELRFVNEEGNNVTIGLDDPIEPADEMEIADAMSLIAESDAFITAGGGLASARDARIVERNVSTIYEAE